MPKERISATVDPDVKRELEIREDVNVSGAINDFLKRLLRGEAEDAAAMRIEVERKREKAADLREQAESLIREADYMEQELEAKQAERQQTIAEAVDEISVCELRSQPEPVIETAEARVATLADETGLSTEELKERARQRFKNNQHDTDRSFQ